MSSMLTKPTRVAFTIFGIIGVASVMLLVLGRISRLSTIAGAHSTMSTTRMHRILCYGDSLTAGTSGFNEEYPYAPYLEAKLRETRGDNVMVRYRGLPGWTTEHMVEDLDGERTGLRSALRKDLSLVILLAGTNDMGYGKSADEITANLKLLHNVCLDYGVPKTLAIGIPPSGYQSQNEAAAALASTVSANLEALEEDPRVTFVPFPFEYERDGDNWYPDGLHFSKTGYKLLGESLAPAVEKILNSLDAQQDS